MLHDLLLHVMRILILYTPGVVIGNEKVTHERPPAPVHQESPPPGEAEPQPGSQWQPP